MRQRPWENFFGSATNFGCCWQRWKRKLSNRDSASACQVTTVWRYRHSIIIIIIFIIILLLLLFAERESTGATEKNDTEEKEVPRTICLCLSLCKWPSRNWLVPRPVAVWANAFVETRGRQDATKRLHSLTAGCYGNVCTFLCASCQLPRGYNYDSTALRPFDDLRYGRAAALWPE